MTEDSEIGRTLARLRGTRSQQFLADRMRERGWRWSQATVWSIEKGDRPLRLAEAADVAKILGADSVADLVGEPLGAAIAAAVAEHRVSIHALMDAVVDFEQTRANIVPPALLAADSGYLSEAALDAIASTPEEVLEYVRGDYAHRENSRLFADAEAITKELKERAGRG